MLALAELLNPEGAEPGLGFSDGVACFEDKDPVGDAKVVREDNPLADEPIEVEVVELAALDVVDDTVVLGGILYPASA